MTQWTAGKVLAWAQEDFKKRGMSSPRLEAEVLLCDILKVRRLDLYTGFDRPLEETELRRYRNAIVRRRAGEPAAYITGKREFWSLSFDVTGDVLIPRPDTETLVDAALSRITDTAPILDLCTGTGCVAVALASERAEVCIDAVDISDAACKVAVGNVRKHGLEARVRVIEGDLYAPLDPARPYQIITANPPYVTTDELLHLQPEVRKEPALALDGGSDGLDIVRRIVARAAEHLIPEGWLLMEVDPRQTDEIVSRMAPPCFGERVVIPDLAGHARVVALKKTEAPPR